MTTYTAAKARYLHSEKGARVNRECQRRWRQKMRVLIRELKGGTCQGCGQARDPEDLHFHHRDPATKRFALSNGRSEVKIRAEAEKCDVLCQACHSARHRDANV